MDFTHLDERGNAVMVDVTDKAVTRREAVASGSISMNRRCYQALKEGGIGKGDVLAVARVAGIMAAKRTSELIPLCHGLALTKAAVDFTLLDEWQSVEVRCRTLCQGKTGVEMEALTGATVALLTVYDMCKAMDRGMIISQIRLLEKEGGKSGAYRAPALEP